MDPNRKKWNDQQKMLRQTLKAADRRVALDAFLVQHAMVHSARVSKTGCFSFEDEILNELPADLIRQIPPKSNHSIAWIIWHIARIEDVTMNLLIAGKSQVLFRDGWFKKLGIQVRNTGNGMSDREVTNLSMDIDISNLRAYRAEVGRETRKIARKPKPVDYGCKVDFSGIQRIRDEQAMLPKARAIVNYWSKKTIGGLLLMPPTRHNFLHLNEARRIRSTLHKLNDLKS